MPVPKTPEQTSPVSPLLQYDEVADPPLRWAETYDLPSKRPAYPTPPTSAKYHQGYFAYDEPPPASYAPAVYGTPVVPPPPPPELPTANSGYDYSSYNNGPADIPRSTGYTWVDAREGDDIIYDEEYIDEKAAMQYDRDLYEYQQPQTLRFGVPPEEPTRRRGTKLKKKVVLTDGNLVVDLPVPENLRLGRMQDVMDEMRSVR